MGTRKERNPGRCQGGTSELLAGVSKTVSGTFAEGHNLTHYVDFRWLPGRKRNLYYSNEGLLSTIPAVATTLLGIMAGWLLTSPAPGAAGRKSPGCWRRARQALCWGCCGARTFRSSSGFGPRRTCSSPAVTAHRATRRVFTWWSMCGRPAHGANRWCGWERMPSHFTSPPTSSAASTPSPCPWPAATQQFVDAHIAKGCGDLLIAAIGLVLAFWLARFLYRRKVFLRVY